MSRAAVRLSFGHELMMLYGRINLSQGEFATLVGISSVALHKWETGQCCPKAGSLKRVIAILIHKGAFKQGEEQTEALHLWELAMQRGLKIPFDEVWFAGVASNTSVGADKIGARHDPYNPYPVSSADPNPVRVFDPLSDADLSPTSPDGLTLAPAQTRERRKGLLVMLIALVMLLIIGSAGTLFFYARYHTTDQTYPGYLSGHGTLAFFDPLSQESGIQWSVSDNSNGVSCHFTGGAYHVYGDLTAYLDSCHSPVIVSDFAFEVQLTTVQGYCGGLLFRDDNQEHYYYFLLCEDGLYWVVKGSVGLLFSGRSSAIHTGLGQQNKLAVVANGSIMTFYANEQQIDQEQDSSPISGKIALMADEGRNAPKADIAYRNARLWIL